MQDGERQVAPTRDGIRRDHVARYEWAASFLRNKTGSKVLDLACGVGYGTQLLAESGFSALGFDRDREALAYARANYSHERAFYSELDATVGTIDGIVADAAVCFETIEHLEDPLPMLRTLRDCAPLLLASVPNEEMFPWRGYAFHYRHYTRAQFERLLGEAGFEVRSWWGQRGPDSEVEHACAGRTLIAVCRRHNAFEPKGARVESKARPESKAEAIRAPRSLKVSVDEPAPEHVAIVGLGPSCSMFFELTRRAGGVSAFCDEVWGINAMGDVLRCNRVFHMDDLLIQEARAAAKPDSNIAAMVRWLKTHPGPIYTSMVREGYPGLVAFPLQDVLNGRYDSNGGAPYFNSTAAYAVAYAVHIGVKRISPFGFDYTLPNAHDAEKGRACVEFWLGIAAARGIEITVPESSSLLDACEKPEHRLYGYDCVDVTLTDIEGGVRVSFKDLDTIPTAEEIEQRYDHRRHPNTLVENERKAQHG